MSMFLVEGRNPHETRGQYVLSIESAVAIMEEMKQDFQKVKIYEKVDGEYVTSVRWEREMTNEEWFNGLTTKEKAKWLCDVREHCYYCGAKQIPDRVHCPFGNDKCMNNPHEFEMWLQEEHKDGQDGTEDET